MKISRNKCIGFTLIEILVALLIFAILGAIVSGALVTLLNTRDKTKEYAERLKTLQMASLIIVRDLEYKVDSHLSFFDKKTPIFVGKKNELAFNTATIFDPVPYSARSYLQHVAYVFKDHQWLRRAYPDTRDPHPKIQEQVLLKDVEEVEILYLDQNNQFIDQWQISQRGNLPRAIDIKIKLKNWGQWEWLL